jgi:hypothetical protein
VLRRLVIDGLGFETRENRLDSRVADVHFDQLGRRRSLLAPPAAV